VLLVWCALAQAKTPPSASPGAVSASVAVGAGTFDDRAAGTLDLGLDVARGELRMGLGGRVRFVTGDGLREADWDEAPEGVGLVRYASIVHPARAPGATAFSLALGPLFDVRLGQGTVVDGYTAGLDVDHRRTGLVGRLVTLRQESETLVDDVIGPKILAGRSAWRVGQDLRLGATVALDLTAPDARKAPSHLGVLGTETSFFRATSADGLGVGLSLDLVDVVGVGLGAHLGARAALLRDRIPAVDLRAQAFLGSDGYLPGWFSPLYELARRSYGLEDPSQGQLAAARRGVGGGVGGRLELGLFDRRLGQASLTWLRQASKGDRVVARVSLPHFHEVQVGAWLCLERAGAAFTHRRWKGVLTSEVRLALPRSLFASAELARLYHAEDAALHPLWIATLSLGAVLGE
jgi:hypothetical protein